jgi:hypothetical protein
MVFNTTFNNISDYETKMQNISKNNIEICWDKPYINQFDVENRLNSNVQCIVSNPQLIMLSTHNLNTGNTMAKRKRTTRNTKKKNGSMQCLLFKCHLAWYSCYKHGDKPWKRKGLRKYKTDEWLCPSPLKFWVRTPFMARCTRYNVVW